MPITDRGLGPFLVPKVNGVPTASRRGSWETEDFPERIGRDRLEPFFRLHRHAGVNVIRAIAIAHPAAALAGSPRVALKV